MIPSNYISYIDSKRFGFKIAKINEWESSVENIVRKIKSQGVKLIIARVDSNETEKINELENFGFRLKDIQVTYKYDIKQINFTDLQLPSDIIIREVKNNDIPKLIRIADESFNNYGHYFADSRLDKRKCKKIYSDWTKRSCIDKTVADKVFVGEINNKIAGYLTFKIFKTKNSKYAAGGLGAVSKEFRNQDIFRKITQKGILWGAEIGLEWEEHNVLLTNYYVNRSFSKIGFKIFKSFCTFHCWLIN